MEDVGVVMGGVQAHHEEVEASPRHDEGPHRKGARQGRSSGEVHE